MTSILLVEDDRLIGEMVRLNLEQDGYSVAWETSGDTAEGILLEGAFDVVILDVNLPGRSGFDLARMAREAGCVTPILILTARSDTASKVTGFDVGADDYLTKPFDVPELLARIRALLRRAGQPVQPAQTASLRVGGAVVDLRSGTVTSSAGEGRISPADRRLLALLWRRRSTEIALPEILEELGDGGGEANATSPDAKDHLAAFTSLPAIREALLRLRDLLEPDPERPQHFHLTANTIRFEG